MKPKNLLFDGHDRAGKSSTMVKVWEQRDKIDTCTDRTILSNLVYNEKYGRDVDPESYLKLLPNTKECALIFLYCSRLDALKMRFIATKEKVPPITELHEDVESFKKWFAWLKEKCAKKNMKFIEIDTAMYNQQSVVDMIKGELK